MSDLHTMSLRERHEAATPDWRYDTQRNFERLREFINHPVSQAALLAAVDDLEFSVGQDMAGLRLRCNGIADGTLIEASDLARLRAIEAAAKAEQEAFLAILPATRAWERAQRNLSKTNDEVDDYLRAKFEAEDKHAEAAAALRTALGGDEK